MTSAAVAVTLSAWRRGARGAAAGFAAIALVFAYTTVVNVVERPDGVKIAGFFIAAIVAVSLVSRLWRTLELRVERIELDDAARRFVDEAGDGRAPPHRQPPGRPRLRRVRGEGAGDPRGLPDPARPARAVPGGLRARRVRLLGRPAGGGRGAWAATGCCGREATAIPNAIAALLLYLRDETGTRPHAYFNWTEGNPLLYLIRYVLSGRG